MLLINLLWFVVACFVLIKSAGFVVRALSRIAVFFRLTEFVAGFILLALSTTLPELFVGITSSLKKIGGLAVGTVIGSNIVNLSLIMGVAILVGRGIHMDLKTIRRDLWYMFVIAVLPVILLIDHELSRVDGVVLLCVFVLYVWLLLSQRKVFHKLADSYERGSLLVFISNAFILFIGIALLLVSADFVVKYAKELSIELAIPPIMVGLFLVAVGTSLPELAFSFRAVSSKHEGLAVGDLVGSVIVNSTLVLGIAAVINPITTSFTLFMVSALFMLFVLFVFITFAESDTGLTQKEGLALIVLYVFFVIIEFYMKGVIK